MQHGLVCLGVNRPVDDKGKGEDCLFVDVQGPSSATEDSKLPVYLYIQGGGFSIQSNSNINATGLLGKNGNDFIFVSFNYRVGPYGFLSDGDNITPNIGLHDQRMVMQWVQKNIHKFGGNPKHVLLAGSSAGAESVTLHLTADNGTDHGYFHAVACESPSFATMLTLEEANYQYRQFATRFGCVGSDSLSCLRNLTANEIQEKNYNIPFPGGSSPPKYMYTPSIDGTFVPDYTYRLLEQGKFIKVPSIYGDDQNGGTKFMDKTTATLQESNLAILNAYPFMSLDQLQEANQLYPNPNNTCPNTGCYWRQVSNVYGEARYMCPAMTVSSAMATHGVADTYHYLWDVEDPDEVKSGLGVPHTVEFGALIGPDYWKVPKSYEKGGVNEGVSKVIQRYWTNFAKTFNPNHGGKCGKGKSAEWKRWSPKTQERLVFETGAKTEMKNIGDLSERCDFWRKSGVSMRL